MIKNIKQYLLILTGAFVMALGFNLFLIPNHIAAGGAGGIATILNAEFGWNIPLTVFAVNLVLFAVSLKTMPKSVFLRSAVGALALTLFLKITEQFPPFVNDVVLGASFGGVLVGVGIGLVVRCGASTGGSDFLAVILHSFIKNISVAKWILIIDSVIIVSGGLVFGDYSLMLYAAVSAYISTKVADAMVDGGNSAKSVYIISEKSEEISKGIIKNINRGVTGIYGKGMYTNRELTVLMCIVKRNEIQKLRAYVKSIDEKAFIILSEVREVLGEGF